MHLKNFKRFTDLEIDLSSCAGAAEARAADRRQRQREVVGIRCFRVRFGAATSGECEIFYHDYFTKSGETGTRRSWISLGGGVHTDSFGSAHIRLPRHRTGSTKSAFYGRSSFRTVPELHAQDHPQYRPHRYPPVDLAHRTRTGHKDSLKRMFVLTPTSPRLTETNPARGMGRGLRLGGDAGSLRRSHQRQLGKNIRERCLLYHVYV